MNSVYLEFTYYLRINADIFLNFNAKFKMIQFFNRYKTNSSFSTVGTMLSWQTTFNTNSITNNKLIRRQNEHWPCSLQASHVVVDGLELPLGGRGQDGQLIEGPAVASVDVARFLVVLTGSAVIGRILKKPKKVFNFKIK